MAKKIVQLELLKHFQFKQWVIFNFMISSRIQKT